MKRVLDLRLPGVAVVALVIGVGMLPAFGGRSPIKVRRAGTAAVPLFPTALPLCAALAAGDKSGDWWCLSGSGTMASGSAITLSPVGSPTVTEWPVCPSGTGCVMEDHTLINPVAAPRQNYKSASVAAPTGSFTMCVLGTHDSLGAGTADSVATLGGFGTDNSRFHLALSRPNLSTGLTVHGGDGFSSFNASTSRASVFHEPMLHCGIFSASAVGTACTFLHGDASPACVSAANSMATIPGPDVWDVGASASNMWPGLFRGAFMTEKVLSAADIGRIGAAVFPPAPAALTMTRSSTRSCCFGDKCTLLPANVPCVVDNVVTPEPQAINTSSWVLTSSINTTTTDSAARYLFGMQTARQYAFAATEPAPGAPTLAYVTTTVTYGAGTKTCSAYIKSVSGDPFIDQCSRFQIVNGGADLWKDYVCSTCALNTSTFTRCSMTTPSTTTNIDCGWGNMTALIAATGPARTARTVILTAPQVERGATATSFIETKYNNPVATTRAVESCSGTGCIANPPITADLTTGLRGYWALNGDSTDALGAYNGTDTAMSYAAGKIGNGGSFNGSTSKIVLGTVPLDSNNWSMSCWMKPTSVASGRSFAYYGAGPTFYMSSGAFWVAHTGTLDLNFVVTVATGTWQHMAATRSGSTITAYMDGVQVARNTAFAATFTADTTVQLGISTAYGEPYTGMLDECAIWDHALSATDVAALYNYGAGLAYPF